SRRRHTRFSRDWSSDVCSSDLWFQQRLESVRGKPQHSVESRRHLLERLTAAEGLEKYLGTKYPGTKRFGVEGGESLIPMLDEIRSEERRVGKESRTRRGGERYS